MDKIKTEMEKQIYSDIQDKIWNYYDKNGIVCKKNEDVEETLIDFLAFLSRRISTMKRKVHYSSELVMKIKEGTFTDELVNVLKLYEEAFTAGKDMNGFLSNNTKNARQPDFLLYTWKLYHLHMSGKFVDSPEQMKNNRSNTQLLCVVDNESVYFVDVVPHPEKGKDNFELSHLKILRNNGWLEKIGFVEIKNIMEGTLNPIVAASDDIFELYRRGCNTAFQLDGKVYAPIDPLMANLRPVEVTRAMMRIMKKIRSLENEYSGCIYKGFRIYTCEETGRVHGVIDLELLDGTLYMVLLFY